MNKIITNIKQLIKQNMSRVVILGWGSDAGGPRLGIYNKTGK